MRKILIGVIIILNIVSICLSVAAHSREREAMRHIEKLIHELDGPLDEAIGGPISNIETLEQMRRYHAGVIGVRTSHLMKAIGHYHNISVLSTAHFVLPILFAALTLLVVSLAKPHANVVLQK